MTERRITVGKSYNLTYNKSMPGSENSIAAGQQIKINFNQISTTGYGKEKRAKN